jgi:hypothetical protein
MRSPFMPSVDDQGAVHVRVEIRRAALRRAIEVVAAGLVDLERRRERRPDHRTVHEHLLIEAVDGEPVSGAEAVVGRRELDRDDLAGLDVDLGRL